LAAGVANEKAGCQTLIFATWQVLELPQSKLHKVAPVENWCVNCQQLYTYCIIISYNEPTRITYTPTSLHDIYFRDA